jgi:hypothetical protein
MSNTWCRNWICLRLPKHPSLIWFVVTKHGRKSYVRGPYYSDSELCGGAVTVSFPKYLPWQAMHFLQRSTHFSKTCCRPFAPSLRRIVEQEVLTFHVRFSVSKALPELENRSSSHCIVYIRLMDELLRFQNSVAQRWLSTKEISSCSSILKRALLKRLLTTVRGMRITPLLRYPTTTTWHNSHLLPLHNSSTLPPVH